MDYGLGRTGWYPAATDFAEAIAHVSNYPLAYVYAMFEALSGHIIGLAGRRQSLGAFC